MLALPASSRHDSAVRWRQLVELAARVPSDGSGDLIGQAISVISEGAATVDERVRVAAALAVAPLPLPAALVAVFAADRLAVAAPVLAGARLTASEWQAVAAAASSECRAFIAAMRSDPAQSAAPAPPKQDRDDHSPIPSISEVVARIERIRQARDEGGPDPLESPQPVEEARLFRWECDETGEIDWVEGVPRGALVGQSIAQLGSGERQGSDVERAFASRAPFHDAVLDLPGEAAIGGRWKISGVPAFERSTGRFAGYRGVAKRSDEKTALASGGAAPDSLRELAHEIRTPLNAIIGFAEIIWGEYLGPADGDYRNRAMGIVTQARLLLTAVEDLDFVAKLKAETGNARPRVHLDKIIASMRPELEEIVAPKKLQIEVPASARAVEAAVQPELAHRLMVRLIEAVADLSGNGETLRISVNDKNGSPRIVIDRPAGAVAQCGGCEDEHCTLRLARGLAKAAGVSLAADSRNATLIFPRS